MTPPHCRLRAPKCSPSRQAMAAHRGHAHWAHEFSTVLMQSMRAFSHIRYRRLMCACSSLSQRLTLTISWLFLEKTKKGYQRSKKETCFPNFVSPGSARSRRNKYSDPSKPPVYATLTPLLYSRGSATPTQMIRSQERARLQYSAPQIRGERGSSLEKILLGTRMTGREAQKLSQSSRSLFFRVDPLAHEARGLGRFWFTRKSTRSSVTTEQRNKGMGTRDE